MDFYYPKPGTVFFSVYASVYCPGDSSRRGRHPPYLRQYPGSWPGCPRTALQVPGRVPRTGPPSFPSLLVRVARAHTMLALANLWSDSITWRLGAHHLVALGVLVLVSYRTSPAQSELDSSLISEAAAPPRPPGIITLQFSDFGKKWEIFWGGQLIEGKIWYVMGGGSLACS